MFEERRLLTIVAATAAVLFPWALRDRVPSTPRVAAITPAAADPNISSAPVIVASVWLAFYAVAILQELIPFTI